MTVYLIYITSHKRRDVLRHPLARSNITDTVATYFLVRILHVMHTIDAVNKIKHKALGYVHERTMAKTIRLKALKGDWSLVT